MKSIPFAAKWPRIARLSLALVTVAGTICASHNQIPQRYTVIDLGLVGPPPASPTRSAEVGWLAGKSPSQIRPWRTLFFGNKGRGRTSAALDSEGRTAPLLAPISGGR